MSTPIHARARATGFTLIEVMIVVAIIAILAAVALPSYSSYIRRSAMQEAFSNLADQRIRLEQFYQDNRRYGPSAATTCRGAADNVLDLEGDKYFEINCTTSNSGQNYTLTATGRTGGTTDGYTYTLTDSGAKATTQFSGSTVTSSCWAIKSASDCQ